jgi:hypothetical protein
LDFCNSLLCNITDSNITQLQKLHNRLARLISCTSSAKELRRLLNWPPVRQRFSNKLAVITYTLPCIEVNQPVSIDQTLSAFQVAAVVLSTSSIYTADQD